MGNGVPPLHVPLLVVGGNEGKSKQCPDPSQPAPSFLPGCVQRWETVRGGFVVTRRGRAQSSVRDSVRVSSGGSCCTSGTTMPRWSFSKDCFIWEETWTG